MLASEFGFVREPFKLTPDPKFLYTSPDQTGGYSRLFSGIRARDGLLLLTGEAGTGKTLLLRRIEDELNAADATVFFFCNPVESFEELLGDCCDQLGLNSKSASGLPSAPEFAKFIAKSGRVAVLLLDEAHALPDKVLTKLIKFSILTKRDSHLLQIVLSGQPSLYDKLEDLGLEAAASSRTEIRPLAARDVGPFIQHQLRIAGSQDAELFSAEAIERIAHYSEGVPRRINALCGIALLTARLESQSQVSAGMVDQAAEIREIDAPQLLLKHADTDHEKPASMASAVEPDADGAPTVLRLNETTPETDSGETPVGKPKASIYTFMQDGAEQQPPELGRIQAEALSKIVEEEDTAKTATQPDLVIDATTMANLDGDASDAADAGVLAKRPGPRVWAGGALAVLAAIGLAFLVTRSDEPVVAEPTVDSEPTTAAVEQVAGDRVDVAEPAIPTESNADDAPAVVRSTIVEEVIEPGLEAVSENGPQQMVGQVAQPSDIRTMDLDAAPALSADPDEVPAAEAVPSEPMVAESVPSLSGLSLPEQQAPSEAEVSIKPISDAEPALALEPEEIPEPVSISDKTDTAMAQVEHAAPDLAASAPEAELAAPAKEALAEAEVAAGVSQLVVSQASGSEDTPVPLDIAMQTSGDAEKFVVILRGLPPGAQLSAGQASADGWRLSASQLDGLTLTPPVNDDTDFELSLTMLDTVTQAVVDKRNLSVSLDAVADPPGVRAFDANGDQYTVMPLLIKSWLADTDGSENMVIKLSGLPPSATLSAGRKEENGTWTLGPQDLYGLVLTPRENSPEQVDMKITVVAIESSNNAMSTTSTTVQLGIVPGPAPVLEANNGTVESALSTDDPGALR